MTRTESRTNSRWSEVYTQITQWTSSSGKTCQADPNRRRLQLPAKKRPSLAAKDYNQIHFEDPFLHQITMLACLMLMSNQERVWLRSLGRPRSTMRWSKMDPTNRRRSRLLLRVALATIRPSQLLIQRTHTETLRRITRTSKMNKWCKSESLTYFSMTKSAV